MFGLFESYLNRLGHRTYKYVLRLSAHKVWPLATPKSDILGFGNVHTSVAAALTLRMFHVEQFHLAFSVGSKEEVDHLTQQMSDDGITIVGQPRTTGDGYYESVVLDPEGNRIEITE